MYDFYENLTNTLDLNETNVFCQHVFVVFVLMKSMNTVIYAYIYDVSLFVWQFMKLSYHSSIIGDQTDFVEIFIESTKKLYRWPYNL